MAERSRRTSLTPAVFYKDNRAALAWLETAFDFEVAELLTDADGAIVHAEMSYGDSRVMVGGEWAEWTRSPASIGGANTQLVHVRVDRDIDGHCERARKAGADIVQEPADQFYGDRTYRAFDPEGHCWTFSQAVRTVSKAEMEKASGFTFKSPA